MKKFSNFVVEHSKLLLIVSLLLLIPAIFGYINTRINYDILVYLPDDVETIKGEKILIEDFELGSYAFVMTDSTSSKRILSLENDIRKIEGVKQVISIADLTDIMIPIEMLPSEIVSKINKNNETIVMVTFDDSTSSDRTIQAVRDLREVVNSANSVSSMTSMVIDTMDLSDQEFFMYVLIAVIFCFIILLMATDSYLIPILLLSNIGVAILYNMGSNLFLGEISYITQAITAILQLGVTTDFSIFLYHKFEQAKKETVNKKEAMKIAICETFKSVIGSSLTTFAGFLALCTMDLTLGTDIGLVMAKGVLCGLICVLSLFPALLLVFDSLIEKTKHKLIFPTFQKVQNFCIQHYKKIIIVFLLLLIPAYIGNSRYEIYYKLDESLPQDLPFQVANSHLAEEFNIVSPEILLIDKNLKENKVNELVEELKEIEGIDLVLAPSTLMDSNLADLLLNGISFENDKYQLLLINSTYEIASNALNEQTLVVESIVKKYDPSGIVAGEGPLMKDLVTIADHDFKAVNYTSLLIIFIIMIFVLKQIALPVLLIFAIEFAIFVNMSFAYYMGTSLPFIASIVVGTIQLGATIDYAILLSTKYLEERKVQKDKKKAMKDTLMLTVPSIITSALCFFAATFGVSVFTKIDMIGSICHLLARGSMISMFVVIFILPSLLFIFDGMIVKKSKKEGVNMKRLNKGVSIFLLTILLLQPISVFALEKKETVYAKLDRNGNVYHTVVSNHLSHLESGSVEDQTNLSNILNLNGEENFKLEGENIVWESVGKDIFYQGEASNVLPITVKVTYYLNEEEIDVEDLVGKSGNIRIELKFLNNTTLNDKGYVVPFVVAVGTVLDNEENSNIEVVNGKSIDTGSKNYVLGLSSPGLYESLKIKELKNFDQVSISYETTSFSNHDLYIVATPKLLEEADFAIFDKGASLYSSMKVIKDSMNKLETGAKELEKGSEQLLNGSTEISTNLKSVLAALEELENGTKAVDDGLLKMLSSLKNASSSLSDPNVAGSLANIQLLMETNETTIATLQAVGGNEQIVALLEQNNKTLQALLMTLKSTQNQVNGMLSTLKTSVSQLENGTNQLSAGLTKVKNGVSALYNGSVTLQTGSKSLNTGAKTLSSGVTKLNKEGISVLMNYATKLNQYSTRAKELVKLSKEYQGFASNNATSTTLIYKVGK